MTLRTNARAFALALVVMLAVCCTSCGVYSFTGTSISPDIKTISIQNFVNSSGEGPSNLTQVVTNNFKNYYQRNTNLTVLQRDGDLQLEGQIISFTLTPNAVQREGNIDQATLNRLTLGVQIRFTNTKDPEQDFDQQFTITQEFPQDVDITRIPQASIEQMTERLVADVFNKTVANW
ncbi:LptE family protein [Pontibacter sp. JH31]|uniref:LptE family protein n=1 Tax=Pontibacter aquaedesilientis TaxID=2766980 RepID=A0ABR7XD89_9BACT|nr:LptE family protein [Pontibacter aquaedesilientis]MBD1396263.1 LptE family protein [Pontibacter aquaedesilientis]